MNREATKIVLSDLQRTVLDKMSKATHIANHYKTRATIILKASDKTTNTAIARELKVTRGMVIRWRNRWSETSELLNQIERDEPAKLKKEIQKVLSDEYRCGAPSKFTPEEMARIFEVSFQKPEVFDVPGTYWTCEELAQTVTKLGIVESISDTQVWRFLKRRTI